MSSFSALLQAVEMDDEVRVSSLLQSSSSETQEVDSDGFTALHVAVQFGSTKVAKLLISYGFSLSARNKAGQTPLHLCRGELEAATLLLGMHD